MANPLKRRKLRSEVWDYFTVNHDRTTARCNICSSSNEFKTTNGSTSTLIKHLRTVHNININSKVHPANDEELVSTAELVSRFAACDGISFSRIATSDTFGQLFQRASCSDVPRSPNGVRDLVLSFSDEKKQEVIVDIKKCISSGQKFSITLDEWTSTANRRYMNLNVHAVNGKFWNLGLIRLRGSVTSEACLNYLKDKLQQFGISFENDIACMITDGASVMTKLGRISGKAQQLCFAHGIHLAVTEVLYKTKCNSNEEVCGISDENNEDDFTSPFEIEGSDDPLELEPIVCEVVCKVRQIVKIFRKSPLKNETLQAYVKKSHGKELNLVLDVRTRWNSMLSMLERFVVLKFEVQKALIDIGEQVKLSEREYTLIEELVRILKPVQLVVEALCKRETSLLSCDAALNFMMKIIKTKESEIGARLFNALKVRLKERRTYLSNVLEYLHKRPSVQISAGTLKRSDIFQELGKSALTNKIQHLALMFNAEVEPELENGSLSLTQFSEMEECDQSPDLEFELYNAMKIATTDENTRNSILPHSEKSITSTIRTEMKLWEGGGSRGKILQEIYCMLLTIPPTSVESERVFSSSSYLCSKVRSRLADNTLDSLVFLRSYFRKS